MDPGKVGKGDEVIGVQTYRLADVFLCLGIAFERVMGKMHSPMDIPKEVSYLHLQCPKERPGTQEDRKSCKARSIL